MTRQLALVFLTPLILLHAAFALTEGNLAGGLLLRPRQTIPTIPTNIPSKCLSGCDAIANIIESCENDQVAADLISCACNQVNADSLNSCAACIISANPGTSTVSDVEAIQSEYFSECAAAGVPLDSPPPSSATATAAANPFKNAGMAMSLSLFVCLMGMVVGGAVVLL